MEKAFGKYWKAQIEKHFPILQSRCHHLRNCLFLSPRKIIEFDFYQTPPRDNIVVRSEYSTSNHSWMKLWFDISRVVPRGSMIESNLATTPRTITTTTTMTTTTTPTNTTSTRTTTSVMVSDPAIYAITTSCNALPGGNHDVIAEVIPSTTCAACKVSEIEPCVKEQISKLANQLLKLQKGSSFIADTGLTTQLCCLGNEVFQKSEVIVQSVKGSVPQKWVRVIKLHLESSDRTTRRVVHKAATFQKS